MSVVQAERWAANAAGFLTLRAEAGWNAEDFYLQRGYEPTGPRPADGPRPIVKRLTDHDPAFGGL